MVRIHHSTTDKAAAWRVRDSLAAHPLLGGAMAQISVAAANDHVMLTGWIADDHLKQIAVRLSTRAVGRRPIYVELKEGRNFSPCAPQKTVDN